MLTQSIGRENQRHDFELILRSFKLAVMYPFDRHSRARDRGIEPWPLDYGGCRLMDRSAPLTQSGNSVGHAPRKILHR